MTLGAGIKKIVQSQGGTIQTFDFYDLAAGRGIVTLYAGDLGTSGSLLGPGTLEFRMSNIKWYSERGSSVFGGDFSPIDMDFDMILNRPMIIQGNCLVNIPFMLTNGTGSEVSPVTINAVNFYKVANGTETFISSGGNVFRLPVPASNSKYHLAAINVDIPKTQLKQNETLRFNLITSGAVPATNLVIGHDPQGRTNYVEIPDGGGATHWGTTTALTINLPVYIDQ